MAIFGFWFSSRGLYFMLIIVLTYDTMMISGIIRDFLQAKGYEGLCTFMFVHSDRALSMRIQGEMSQFYVY